MPDEMVEHSEDPNLSGLSTEFADDMDANVASYITLDSGEWDAYRAI